MDRFFRAITRLVMLMTISFGVRPPVLAVLELLQRPSVRIVMITRRRSIEYAAFFMIEKQSQRGDEDSAYQSATEERSEDGGPAALHCPTRRTYTPVRTA